MNWNNSKRVKQCKRYDQKNLTRHTHTPPNAGEKEKSDFRCDHSPVIITDNKYPLRLVCFWSSVLCGVFFLVCIGHGKFSHLELAAAVSVPTIDGFVFVECLLPRLYSSLPRKWSFFPLTLAVWQHSSPSNYYASTQPETSSAQWQNIRPNTLCLTNNHPNWATREEAERKKRHDFLALFSLFIFRLSFIRSPFHS